MKIQEAIHATGLTKKAIYYYEAEGLIKPGKANDGYYRDYSDEDIRRLHQISFLRHLDFSLKDIRQMIDNPEDLHNILVKQMGKIIKQAEILQHNRVIIEKMQSLLELYGPNSTLNDWKTINQQYFSHERGNSGFMKREIKHLFPGKVGQILAIWLGPFLEEPIDSEIKVEAWEKMVHTLDNTAEIGVTTDFHELIDRLDCRKYDEKIDSFQQIYEEQVDFTIRYMEGLKEKYQQTKDEWEEYMNSDEADREMKKIHDCLERYQPFWVEEIEKYLLILSEKYRQYYQASTEML